MPTIRIFAISFLLIAVTVPSYPRSKQEGRPLFIVQKDNHVSSSLLEDTLDYQVLPRIQEDFVVNEGCGEHGTDQSYLNIARRSDGSYICVWVERRTGLQEVNAQLFDADDEPVSGIIPVSDGYDFWNVDPRVKYNPGSREYIITWATSAGNILFQRVSIFGDLVRGNTVANQTSRTNTNNPSVGVDVQGNFLIAWVADSVCCFNSQTYYRIFGPNGLPATDEQSFPFLQSTSAGSRSEMVAEDASGNWILVWSVHVDGFSRVVMQPLNRDGLLTGEVLVVSNLADSSNHFGAGVASTADGHFLLLWESTLPSPQQETIVMGRIYSIASGFVSPEFVVTGPTNAPQVAASSDGFTNFNIVWVEGGTTALGRVVDKTGQFVGATQTLSLDAVYAYGPKITNNALGTIKLTYFGSRDSEVDIMVQSLDASLRPLGPPVTPVDDRCQAWQTEPVVRFNQAGRSLVTWVDARHGGTAVYGQVLDEAGGALSENILISDTSQFLFASHSAIAADPLGDFIVSFSAGEYLTRDVVLQKVSADGRLIGGNRILSAPPTYLDGPLRSFLNTNDIGEVRVCWFHENQYSTPLMMTTLDADLVPRGEPVTLLAGDPSPPKRILGATINDRFEMFAMWVDYDPQFFSNGNILWGMNFDSDGRRTSSAFGVDTLMNSPLGVDGSCRIDSSGNLIVAWGKNDRYSAGLLNVVRLYPSEGKRLKNVYESGDEDTKRTIAHFDDKRALVAWSSGIQLNALYIDDKDGTIIPVRLNELESVVFDGTHNAYGLDVRDNTIILATEAVVNPDQGYEIYVNTQSIKTIGTFGTRPPETFALRQNYPNPFNPTTTIAFDVPVPSLVSVHVYDLLGQFVGTILEGQYEAGTHTHPWNATGLPSGVYFIRLESRGLAWTTKAVFLR